MSEFSGDFQIYDDCTAVAGEGTPPGFLLDFRVYEQFGLDAFRRWGGLITAVGDLRVGDEADC